MRIYIQQLQINQDNYITEHYLSHGESLYYVTDEDCTWDYYVRASDKDDAIAQVQESYPLAQIKTLTPTSAPMSTFIHYCAVNDVNGNPQRCYVLHDEDQTPIAVWDEGYMGSDAVPGVWRKAAYNARRVKCSETKYRKLLKTLPSPRHAYEVVGYSHLQYI
jgi:hypothetical protein